jgi:DNA-directed RNA polymerase subunit RPC12/RpoP
MGTRAGAEERVDAPSFSLHCTVCGAGNRFATETREQGWLRCAHCGSGIPVPGVGDFVVEGPRRSIRRIVRPGSSEIDTDDGVVFDFLYLVVLVAAADVLGSGAIELVRRADPVLADALWPALLALVLTVAGLGTLGFLTRQRLVIRNGDLSLSWVTLGVEWRRRRLDTGRFRAGARTKGRAGVELQTPGGSLCMRVESADAAAWLEREVLAAVSDARTPAEGVPLACPGCGGPVADERELRTTGGLDCEHCGTGLVATRGGIGLPPARLSDRLRTHPKHPEPLRDGQGSTLSWTLPSWASGHPVALWGHVLLLAGFLGLMLTLAWLPALAAPVLRAFAVSAAVAVTMALAFLTWLWLRWTFGWERFRLDGTVLQHDITVGPWRSKTLRIPLARVLSVDGYDWLAERAFGETSTSPPRDRARLRVKTATAEYDFDLVGEWKLGAVRDLVAVLGERLALLGR